MLPTTIFVVLPMSSWIQVYAVAESMSSKRFVRVFMMHFSERNDRVCRSIAIRYVMRQAQGARARRDK